MNIWCRTMLNLAISGFTAVRFWHDSIKRSTLSGPEQVYGVTLLVLLVMHPSGREERHL